MICGLAATWQGWCLPKHDRRGRMRKIISLGLVFLVRYFFMPSYTDTEVHLLFLVISRKEERMKNIDITTVGGRIKKLRMEKGLSQEELAEMLFLNAKNISAYENNRNEVPSAVLADLAKALDSSMDYIYTGIETVEDDDPDIAEAIEMLKKIGNKALLKMVVKNIKNAAECELS